MQQYSLETTLQGSTMDKEKSLMKKFIGDFLKYTPSSFIPALIGFLTIPILTKLFAPSDYGNYVLAISVVGFFAMIIQTLLGTPITRFFYSNKENENLESFYDTIVSLSITSTIIVTLFFIAILIIFKSNQGLYNLLLIGIPLFIVTSLFGILKQVLVAKEKSHLYSFFTSFQALMGFLIGIGLIFVFNFDITGIIWGNILSFLMLLPFIYYYSFKGIFTGKNHSKKIYIDIIKYGSPLIIGNLASWILSISDRYILEFYRGSVEVGIYSASYGVSEQTITVIWSLFMIAAYPLIVRMWETQGEKPTQKYISKLTRYYLLISFPAALGLSILAKPVVSVLTSAAYLGGYQIIPLVIFGALLLGLQWWAQLGLLLHNKPNMIGVAVLIAGIINIILNILLVPVYGYIAAAVSTFISYLILLLLMIKIGHKALPWHFPFKPFLKIIVASAIMGIVIYYLQDILTIISLKNLGIEIIVGILIYLVSLTLLKGFNKDEINELTQLFKK